MGQEDLAVFHQFPEEINIYRGVAVYRNPDGISWTMDSKTAEWFAHRFDTGKQHGYVRTGMIDKRHILAYFDERGEKEIVIDRNYFKGLQIGWRAKRLNAEKIASVYRNLLEIINQRIRQN